MHGMRAARRVHEMDRLSAGESGQRKYEDGCHKSKPRRPHHTGSETSCTYSERQRNPPLHPRLELTQERRCKRRPRCDKQQHEACRARHE